MSERVKIMKWFRPHEDDRGMIRAAGKIVDECADELVRLLPDNDQSQLALTLLLQARDAAMRSIRDDNVEDY